MKNRIKVTLNLALVAILTLTAASSSIVSPALNILAKKNSMIKSGLIYNDIYFSEQDFMKSLGVTHVDNITVEVLPEPSEGVLKLGNLNVAEGQTISSEYVSVLRFVPASEKITSSSVVFDCDGTEVPCILKYLEEVNYAPTFAEAEDNVKTYRISLQLRWKTEAHTISISLSQRRVILISVQALTMTPCGSSSV